MGKYNQKKNIKELGAKYRRFFKGKSKIKTKTTDSKDLKVKDPNNIR